MQWTNTESQYFAWSNQQFYAALAADNNNSSPIPPWTLTNFRSTWDEQRRWGINYALDALSLSTNPTDRLLYHDIMTEINHITSPKSPFDSLSNKQWQKVDVDQSFTVKSSFDNRKYQIKFDSNNGALTELTNMEYSIKFASNDNLIGQFIYQTLTEQDFDNFMSEYSIVQPQPEWMLADFGKQELDFNANPIHQYITAEFRNLYQSSMDLNEFVVEMDFGEQQMNLTKYYGIPQNIYNYISFNSNSSTFTMEITYINKTMTRIPEDIYFKFDPVNCSDWKLEKFGEYVDLKDIVKNGTAHMHNINNRAYCENINGNDAAGFMIRGIDSGLTVFPPKLPKGRNEFSPFPTPFVEASENDGIGFVLYDNTWGTNYPVWWPFHEYDANTTYRFEILLQ